MERWFGHSGHVGTLIVFPERHTSSDIIEVVHTTEFVVPGAALRFCMRCEHFMTFVGGEFRGAEIFTYLFRRSFEY
jgi:hypothetical protein